MAGACSFCWCYCIYSTMIEFKLKRTAIRLDFSFFAVLALFFWIDRDGFGFIALAVCAAHEMAHLMVMAVFGIIPESITFYGAGIRITAPDTELFSYGVQAAVYSAGCVMNFVLALIFMQAGCDRASALSLFTGCFNLFPVGEFDGRRLLRLFLLSHVRPENLDMLTFIIGVVCAALAGILIMLFGWVSSPTLIITAAYIIIMSIRQM